MFEASTPFRTSQKESFLPSYLEIGDFEIKSNKGFEQAIEFIKYLHLPVGLRARQFGPKGYYYFTKKTVTL